DDLAESIQSGYYLKNGMAANEEFYYLSILITVTGYSAKEVEWRAKEMRKLLNAQDMDTVSCIFKEEQAFLSSLPLLKLEKSIYERSKRNVLTSGAASCYPFTSFEMSDKDGILMGVNTANSSLVIVDIFNSAVYKNANISIMGTTGAGKTFLLQLMALRMRRKNIQVFIIAPDKGHEFARACTNIGGEFIKISSASPNCINVMEIRKKSSQTNEILDGEVVERSELAAKIQDLHIFFSLLIPDMDHEEKQLLDEALVTAYYEKGITHENESLLAPERPGEYRTMPILEDVYEMLHGKTETRRLANILNRLVHGSASSFNQQTNVNLENKYIVLDISELTGDLLPVGMFVVLNYVWSKVKEDRTMEKAIFLDEVWQLIGASSNEMAAEYVLEIFKIIRGYGGSAVCATQDLSDFMALKDGKYGRGIINASKTKIILNLENDEAKKVQELLHLSEAERMEIVHFERGKGMISTNSNNLTLEFKASQLEKDLITTDRQDLKELKERLQRFGQAAYGKRSE
ncbi:MAG: VirB4 family type IV secretion system protein, partial [Enterocloster sp.]